MADTLSFLTQALGQTDLELIPLAGDASNRRYSRVVMGQSSFVLMSWEPFEDPDNYPFLSVQRHFKKHKVKVPEVLALSPEQGLVLLEDLGDLTLERKFWENNDPMTSLPFYRQAVDELIKIHFHSTADRSEPCRAFDIQFDQEKFLWEMNYGLEHLIRKLAGVELSEVEGRALQNVFAEICLRLDHEPKFIAHRDYHSRNLMLKLGQMRVIDFQDARLGPIQYDLVSLVCDSYVQLGDDLESLIVEDYLQKALPYLPAQFSRDQFDSVFLIQSLQRCFKACGSFASFYNTRQDLRYLKYIQPTLGRVASTLEHFPEFQDFSSVLVDRGLLEQDFERDLSEGSEGP